MSLIYTSGTFTTAQPVGEIRFSQPFGQRGDNASYIFEQDWMQFRANFTPITVGTAHGTLTTFLLVSESPLTDMGGNVVKWTRTYAKIPASRTEYDSLSYQFIGFFGPFFDVDEDLVGRNPRTQVVQCRLEYAYDDAPLGIISRTKYWFTDAHTSETEFLAQGTWSPQTDPTRADYVAMIGADITASTGSLLVAEDSVMRLWMGIIYERITKYIVAQ